jgi:hypothetical protein
MSSPECGAFVIKLGISIRHHNQLVAAGDTMCGILSSALLHSLHNRLELFKVLRVPVGRS